MDLKENMLLNLLVFTTVSLTVGYIFWIVFIKRDIFDLRLYVFYGLFHWLMIGQIGTLLGYNFYEVKQFDEVMHIKAAFLILFSVIAFIIGYYSLPVRNTLPLQAKYYFTHTSYINPWKLAWLALIMGIIGFVTMFFIMRNPSWIFSLKFTPFLLTYMSVAASVIATYILIMHSEQLKGTSGLIMKFLLGAILFLFIVTSNVMFIFPLFSIIYWSVYRSRLRKVRVNVHQILKWVVIIACVSIFSLISKRGLQPYLATGEWNQGILKETWHRILTLDLFNVEGYGIVLHAIEMYADSGNLLLGKSLLVLLPFLRLFWDDVRGFGRIIVLDVYGSSYLNVNVGWGVPPIGELTANFGYLSCPIFYLCLGWITRYLFLKFKRSKSVLYAGVYAVLPPWLFIQQRGDVLDGNVPSAYIAILVAITFWLSKRKVRGGQSIS